MAALTNMRRTAKNVAYNYSDAQVKVREATSNDPWGPSSSLMSEVADLTHNAMAFSDIMQMVWKRLNDHGKNWRHVYKSLVLLDYLIKTGSDKVAQQCKENIYAIQTLKDFQHIEENKDQGLNVREKAKALVALLKDDERLKNERSRALIAKKRFAQNNVGISSDGSTHHMRQSNTFSADDSYGEGPPSFSDATGVGRRARTNSELEEARPTSSGEEELQLQIALALSKEEAERETEAAKGDDVRLKMALEESKSGPPKSDPGAGGSGMGASNIDDLLALGIGGPPAPAPAPAADPWASNGGGDPWGAPPPVAADPWAPQSTVAPPTAVSADPWGAPAPQADPFAPAPVVASMNGGGDAWSMEPMLAATPINGNGLSRAEGLVNERGDTKTPEKFLGENSALVNLDNLMGPSKPATAAPAAKALSTNPFAAPGGGPSTTPNPFLAAQRPSPTLAQLQARQSGGTPANAAPEGDWRLAEPLRPGNSAVPPSNPFI